MTMLSKYFTPILGDEEKKQFFDTLGFNQLKFVFLEHFQDALLRRVNYEGTRRRVSLESEEDPTALTIDLRYRQVLGGEQTPSTPSLWEEIFPFPFSLIGRAIRTSDPTLTIRPYEFLTECQDLFARLNDLEKELSESEVGILVFQNEAKNFPLLIHSVRHRRVRVGKTEIPPGDLTPEILFGLYGTSTQLITIELAEKAESLAKNPEISAFSAQIQAALASPQARIRLKPNLLFDHPSL